ncbi:MAG: HypC/HybG/HupF family hydrogenase formation chaperone [Bifidobacteriaceae bacterium]|jgi:hydrogenase expression/formation protein HypC|nr:HypC/HybG/HupF family hydrogenase formation chaperone [Bifidobacteriaceae bacterium]
MCFAIPAQIVEIIPGALPMARLGEGTQPATCCLAYVPQARVGDHVLVRRGFAVEVLDAEAASESLAAFAELGLTTPGTPTPVRSSMGRT